MATPAEAFGRSGYHVRLYVLTHLTEPPEFIARVRELAADC